MKSKILATLAAAVLVVSVFAALSSAGASGKAIKGIGQGPIPRAFVEAYAVSHQPTVAGANAEWNKELAPQKTITDITLPGGTMTYEEALHPRQGLPGETPEQYLNYLSEVGRVRQYVRDLSRKWSEAGSEFLAQQDAIVAEGLVQLIALSPDAGMSHAQLLASSK